MSLFGPVRRSVERAAAALQKTVAALATTIAFAKQREVLEAPAKFIVLRCSGRAGKTRAFLLKWLQVKEQKPGQVSVYVALSLDSAMRLAWAQLKQMNDELGLGLTFNIGKHTIEDGKGSKLILLGANRSDLVDVLRGFPMVLAGFDEAAFFRAGLLERAIYEAVLIRLADFDGECWVMSTPGYVNSGFHFDICEGRKAGFQGWQFFHWTFFDNPHLPAGRDDLSDEQRREWRLEYARKTRERMGWTEDSPGYVREFLGLPADDIASLIYKLSRKRHCIQDMPESWSTQRHRWHTVLGMDYGSTNATSWVLWAFEHHSPIAYCVKARKLYEQSPSQVADITRNEWVDVFKPDVIVGDPAAKAYIDELRVRQQIAVQAADKLDKRAHQRTFNDALTFSPEPRMFFVEPECEEYLDEMEKLGKNPKYAVNHPKYGEEDPGAEKDACDGGLYGYTKVWAWVEELRRVEAEAEAERQRRARDPLGGTALQGVYAREQPTRHDGLKGAFGLGSLRKRG